MSLVGVRSHRGVDGQQTRLAVRGVRAKLHEQLVLASRDRRHDRDVRVDQAALGDERNGRLGWVGCRAAGERRRGKQDGQRAKHGR